MGKENFSRYNQQVECFFVTLYCRFVMQIYWLILNYQLFTRFFFDEKEIV